MNPRKNRRWPVALWLRPIYRRNVALPGTESETQVRRILFSRKKGWENAIRARLSSDDVSFGSFRNSALNPDSFDLVVPLTLSDIRWLNSPAGASLRGKSLVPSDESIALCNDKLTFAELLISQGFGIHVPNITGPFECPYILKRRIGEWGVDSVLITDRVMAQEHLGRMFAADGFRQKYITGRSEFATHLLATGSEITYCGTVEAEFDSDRFVFSRSEQPKVRRAVDHSRHLGLFSRILRKLEFEGLCCFDYKLCDGVVQIFELNPRFGGSLLASPGLAIDAYAQAIAQRPPGFERPASSSIVSNSSFPT